ncbi:MAG TPA: histidine phosphatase family protein [Verrucomicrobiae bacterium]|jgi:broad specificity phosphatase PhoE
MTRAHLPTRLFLLRHGEVEERYHRIFGGRIDMNLSPRGQAQARALAKYLGRFSLDALYVSPMQRAQQTLAPIAAEKHVEAVTLGDLREVDFGDWTGLSWEGVHAKFGVSAFDWLTEMEQGRIPNGESGGQFRARLEPCLHQILLECPGKSVAVVCHGGVIRMLLSILLSLPLPAMAGFEIDYASLTRVDYRERKSEVQVLNLTPWRDLE